MRNHYVHVYFKNNIIIGNELCDQFTITEMVLKDDEKDGFLKRISKPINTTGKLMVKGFKLYESPFDAKEIEIDTNNILEIEHIK